METTFFIAKNVKVILFNCKSLKWKEISIRCNHFTVCFEFCWQAEQDYVCPTTMSEKRIKECVKWTQTNKVYNKVNTILKLGMWD